ncbi:MAG: RraA family protein [bacterium]
MNRYSIWCAVLLAGLACLAACQTAQIHQPESPDAVVEQFSRLTSSSISDAVDRVTGRRGYMDHDMRPVYSAPFCGRAVTVLAQPSTASEPPRMALDLIDTEAPGKVLVIVMDGPDGRDVAAFGGIMCAGAMARGFAGAVLDGGCRDAAEIQARKFPVYARGIVPSNSLGRYVNVSQNQPVTCAGVRVTPGDIVRGDSDGVVVIPQARAEEILRVAQELEIREAATVQDVFQLKSIRAASQKNQRI